MIEEGQIYTLTQDSKKIQHSFGTEDAMYSIVYELTGNFIKVEIVLFDPAIEILP